MNIQPITSSSYGMGFSGMKVNKSAVKKLVNEPLLSRNFEFSNFKKIKSKITDVAVNVTKFIIDIFEGDAKNVNKNILGNENLSKNTFKLVA